MTNHTFRVQIAAVVLVVGAGVSAVVGKPILAFNEDDSHFMGRVYTEAEYRAYIDEVRALFKRRARKR